MVLLKFELFWTFDADFDDTDDNKFSQKHNF